MKLKNILSISFASIGIFLTVFSLSIFQSVTGAVTGTNSSSKMIGIVGILFMIIAVVIEKYEVSRRF